MGGAIFSAEPLNNVDKSFSILPSILFNEIQFKTERVEANGNESNQI
jgi:hypothetical protein